MASKGAKNTETSAIESLGYKLKHVKKKWSKLRSQVWLILLVAESMSN
jgi:hypothetical protein